MIKNINKKSIQTYLKFQSEHPDFYKEDTHLHIIRDYHVLLEYAVSHEIPLGILYQNQYFTLVLDLVERPNGTRFPYFRKLGVSNYNGTVILPLLHGRAVLLENFRHGTRSLEFELPRGFSEPTLPPEENAFKELSEEISAVPIDIHSLGTMVSDSSLDGGEVYLYCCPITSFGTLQEEEGIDRIHLFTKKECLRLIHENKIRDGFTIAAIFKAILSGYF